MSDPSLTFILIGIAASVFGFLFFNFPKSVILLGDVGSCFLGIVIALISIKTSQLQPELFWCLDDIVRGFLSRLNLHIDCEDDKEREVLFTSFNACISETF